MKKILFLATVLAVLFGVYSSESKADFQSEEQQTINASQKLLNATVKIDYGNILTGGAKGTGFYITPNTIITNEHVIHKAPSSQVKLTRKDGTACTGTIGYREEINPDLAIITTDCKGTPLTLATSAAEGQSIIVVGNPLNFDFTVSKGIIGAMRAEMIQFDARVNFGSSGSVLSNLNGEIVGVVTQKANHDDYIALAIPYNKVQQFLNRSGISWQ